MRIDHVFQKVEGKVRIGQVIIGPRIYSDYVLILIQWYYDEEKGRSSLWKMDNSILMNNEIVKRVKREIIGFFHANKGQPIKISSGRLLKHLLEGS